MTTIASLSAAELGPLYASRELSPVEVARDALERIERFEPQINAFVVRDAEVFDPFGAWVFVIVSLKHPEPALRAFRILGDTITEEPVAVTG